MKTATPVQLTCPECQRENEAERVYCHDCGARLDRSALANRKTAKMETAEDLHKRMRGMFSQRRIKARLAFFKTVKIVLAAVAAAALVVTLLPPDVPPAVKTETLPAQINLSLENLTESRQPQTMQFSEGDVNAYLANVMKHKKEKLEHPLLDFERAILGFTEGNCRVTIERSIFGYSIFTSADYDVQVKDGKITATPKSAAIGRMPIHPSALPYAGFLFSDAVAAMDREHKLLNKVGSIQLHDKMVEVANKTDADAAGR
ncbi:MAG TPA: zinc ribbon domain-containing protein [Chthoniobacterales bacterium]|nr:zinc ribbon domain-containing protein [Chthoniobacterales bacterium]